MGTGEVMFEIIQFAWWWMTQDTDHLMVLGVSLFTAIVLGAAATA